MAEDIQLGADVSQAISALGQVGNAFQKIASEAGASDKAVNAAMRNMERSIGGVVADLNKAQSSFARFSAGNVGGSGNGLNQLARGVTQGFQAARRETDAYQRSLTSLLSVQEREAAQAKAMASANLRLNSANRPINAATGRFVGPEVMSQYQGQLTLAEKLVNAEQQYASAKSLTTKQQYLENNLASKFHGVQDDLARQRDHSIRQQQLQNAFASKFYGLADQSAGPLQRMGNLLQQIPPVTWANKISDASTAIMGMSNSTRYAMYDVSNATAVGGAAFIAFGAAAISAAVSHERAFANVRRVTQTSAEGYKVLQRQLEQMSMTLPISYEELTKIATAAGQLGIQASGVAAFTSTVAKLTATTNLTSEAAGTALARFKAFFAETQEGTDSSLAVTEATFSNLASSILKVGVNSIASETGIVNVATQIASMGAYSGMTANQVIGLAGALSSIGVAPELSRGTITRTFSLIGTAVSKGGEDLDKFAKLAGVSSDEFKAAWGTEKFAGVFTDMMTGLYNVTKSGEDANLMLMELGFNSVRDRPLLLRLATAANEAGEAGGLLSQTMADAYQGWRDNSELAMQYNIVAKTTAARLQVLGQSFEQLFATMGNQSGGALGELVSGLTDFVRGLESLASSDGGQVFSTIVVQTALAVGGMLLLVSAGARVVASLQGIGVAYAAMNKAGVTSLRGLSSAMKIANLSLGLVGLVTTLVAVGAGFVSMAEESRKAQRAVQDVDGLMSAMKTDYENGGTAIKQFSDAAKGSAGSNREAAEQAANMTKALYGTEASADAASSSVSGLAKASKEAGYAFGNSAKAFYRAQLQQSPAFQDLFNPEASMKWTWATGAGRKVGEALKAGIDLSGLDLDSYMEKSIKGTLTAGKIQKDIAKQIGAVKLDPETGQFTHEWALAGTYAEMVYDTFSNLSPELKAAAASAAAFGNQGADALGRVASGAEGAEAAMVELDEASKKAIDSMASGLSKFVDVGSLIGLTQQRVAAETDGSKEAAADFEKAWTDAYGGASFKMEDYLVTFRRAGEEQQSFIGNLQELAGRGLDMQIINDLAAMGPAARPLVQALVDGTAEQLTEFQDLWGRTGYDSVVQMAAQMELAKGVVTDVMSNFGRDGLRRFNEIIGSGVGVDAALKQLQGEFNARPVDPRANVPQIPNMTPAQKVAWAAANVLETTGWINVRTRGVPGGGTSGLTDSKGRPIDPRLSFDTGGWTGPGSRLTPKGVVHADEFVFTKRATNAIGVSNLYRMMHQAESGTKAPRGRGYASGGHVGGGGMSLGDGYTRLAPETIQQIGMVMDKIIQVDGQRLGRTVSRGFATDSENGKY